MAGGTLKSLLVKLGVDSSGLKKGLKSAEQQTTKSSKDISSSIKTVAATFAVVSAAAAGVGLVIKKAFELGTQGAAIKRASLALEAYAGSATEAESL